MTMALDKKQVLAVAPKTKKLTSDAFHSAEGLYMNELIDGKPIGVTTNAEGDVSPKYLKKHHLISTRTTGSQNLAQAGTDHIGYKMGGGAYQTVAEDFLKGVKTSGKVYEKQYNAFADNGATTMAPSDTTDSFKEDAAEIGNFLTSATAKKTTVNGFTLPNIGVLSASVLLGGIAFLSARKYTKWKSWEIIAVSGVATVATYLITEEMFKDK